MEMPKTATREDVRRLIDEGAQLVEVLERRQFEKAHIPGAVNIPAWELTRERAESSLTRDRPVLVYCFDNL